MTILPVGKKLQLEIEQPTAGGLDLSAKNTVVECGIVAAISEVLPNLILTAKESGIQYQTTNEINVGDKIFFKAWALDVITYNKETYYFIDADSNGICAIVKE